MPHAGSKPAVGDGRSFATAVGNTAASAPPKIVGAPGAQHFASQRRRSREPEFCAIPPSGVRQVRSSLPLAKEVYRVAGAVIKMEVGIGAGCAASDGLFECDENRTRLRRSFAR